MTQQRTPAAHPPVDQVMRLACGDGDAAEVRAHVDQCGACRSLLALAQPFQPAAPPAVAAAPTLPTVSRSAYADWRDLPDGVGGMGRTYRARDLRLGRVVVIKEPRADAPEALRHRFEREALLTARLQHPAIVSVYEAGRWEGGGPFYAMPWVEGTPLDRAITDRVTLAERLELLPHLIIVAEAVAYAHSQRVVHRDIKPQNVLLGPFGETLLIDWGLAKDLDDAGAEAPAPEAASEDGLTVLGVGTPQYMPPEQALGRAPTELVDVYALGATLYHLVAGGPPYGVGESAPLRRRLLTAPPPRLDQVEPSAPAALVSVIHKAMERDPAHRLPSARRLADELARFRAGGLIETHRYSAGDVLRHWARRHRAPLRVAAAAAVVLMAVGIMAVRGVVAERDRAQQARRLAERSEARARTELVRAQGAIAMQLARDPHRRLEALEIAVAGMTAPVNERPPEAVQGLLDALTLGPACRPLAGHTGLITQLTFGAGERLYSLGDRTLRIWNTHTGVAEAVLESTLRAPFSLQLSADEERLVLSDYYGQPELWQVRARHRQRLDTGAEASPLAVFDPSTGEVVTGGFDGHLRVWDSAGALRATIDLGQPLPALAVAPDGTRVVGLLGGIVRRLTGAGATLAESAPLGEEVAALVAPEGGALIALGDRGTVFHWPAGALGEPPRVHRTRLDRAFFAQLGADQRWLATTGQNGSRLVDLATGRIRRLERTGRSPLSAAGDQLIEWDRDGTVARLWDLRRDQARLRFDGGHQLTTSAFAADGRRLALGFGNGRILVCDPRGRREGRLALFRGPALGLRVLSDRLVGVSASGELGVWDLRSGGDLARLDLGAEILAVAARPDGTGVALGGLDGRVRLVDLDGRLRRDLAVHEGPVTAVAFAAGGTHLLTSSLDGTAALIDLSADRPPVSLRGHRGAVMGIAPAGPSQALTVGADGRALLWDLTAAAVARELAPGAGPLEAGYAAVEHQVVALSAVAGGTYLYGFDGRLRRRLDGNLAPGGAPPFTADGRVATTTATGELILSPLAGDPALVLAGHRSPIRALWLGAASITTAAEDGTLRRWRLADGALELEIDTGTAGGALALAASADDGWIVAGLADGLIRVVPGNAEAALDRACLVLAEVSADEAVRAACAQRGAAASTRTSPNHMRAR